MLRSSEERLGAVAWAVAPRTLSLSVASPPATPYHALRIAAERYGFCPPPEADWAGVLQRLARELEDEHRWRIVW